MVQGLEDSPLTTSIWYDTKVAINALVVSICSYYVVGV